MNTSHRGITQDVIERAPPFTVDDSVSQLPSRWSDIDKWAGLEITGDGLHVRLTGSSKGTDEAAAVRADHPMPRECGIYYYETTIHSRGKEALIGIGFSARKVILNKLPGWEEHSWAYHSDDGYIFRCTPSGRDYGPRFANGDVIGCGVNFRTGSAFFTKNGVNLGTAFNDIGRDKPYYPSVGMKKAGDYLQVNFGDKPFVFDIDGMMRDEKAIIREEISKANTSTLHSPFDESALIQELIAQFLAHDGYVETAKAFAEEVRDESRLLKTNISQGVRGNDPEEDVDAIHRQQIRASILEGDIDQALKLTSAYYPSVLRDNENIYFKLRCRKFIEMIRTCSMLSSASTFPRKPAPNGFSRKGKNALPQEMDVDSHFSGDTDNWDSMDTEGSDTNAKYSSLTRETIEYGQELNSEFSSDPRREVQKALQDTFALIAYTDATQSNLASLLEVSGRVPVAEELNSAILVSLGKSSSAALERVYKQSEALVSELSNSGGAGAFINIREDILRDDPSR
ncbi:SPRY-domain-containing protein [Viridothelium virens]|uniref:SPRY-domain-containing protein n=1 Tax=Viridothelium virens TaxID=1048519 RepID=A0A6A6H7N5_VIRVR|nr:SPRY-domain-containing protein [Viridothelium virens]